MRPGAAGLVLLLGAALAWLALVPPARARARELSRQCAEVERERQALARRVELLERERGIGAAPTGAVADRLGSVELRERVVEALEGLDSGRGIRLGVEDAAGGSAQVSLALAGPLPELLDLIEALLPPQGPVVLSRLDLRPSGPGAVQLQLEGVQPGAGS